MNDTPPTREEKIAPPSIDSDSDEGRSRILVVDDEDALLNFMTRLLNQAGYQVDTASDGEAAWEALGTTHFDLLIIDHNMPKMKGLAVLRKLRGISLSLPCILISGVLPVHERDFKALLQPGAAFEKSLQFSGLLPKVRELLAAAQFPGVSKSRSAMNEMGEGEVLHGNSEHTHPSAPPSALPSTFRLSEQTLNRHPLRLFAAAPEN